MKISKLIKFLVFSTIFFLSAVVLIGIVEAGSCPAGEGSCITGTDIDQGGVCAVDTVTCVEVCGPPGCCVGSSMTVTYKWETLNGTCSIAVTRVARGLFALKTPLLV